MLDFEQSVLNIIKETPDGILARKIAEQLEIDKKQVNSLLYGSLRNLVWQDSSYKWHVKTENAQTPVQNVPQDIDNELANICHYYLNCLNLEQDSEIHAFASSNFADSLAYTEIKGVNEFALKNPETEKFLQRICMQRRMSLNIGYPVLLRKVHSTKHNKNYFFVVPVFLFNMDINGQTEMDPLPRVNMEVIKYFSSTSNDEKIYELIGLENELGLNGVNADIELDDLTARLQSIRDWTWMEPLDPNNITEGQSLSEITTEGIYNRAIIIATERSPYTEGLEMELSKMAVTSTSVYKNTALYKWIHGQGTEIPVPDAETDDNLLEVLPLNTEQEQAVKQAFKSDLTVVTGPPGTGKSQVVTDLLLNAAWKHMHILFASKNNKAVDVVDYRVNGLSSRPIMVRLGSNTNAGRLAELIDNLLNSINNYGAKDAYEASKAQYDERLSINKKLKDEKSKYVIARNRVDKFEQRYNLIRTDYSKYFYTIYEKDISELEKAVQNCLSLHHRAQKSEQPALTRLLWFLYSSKRYEEYRQSAEELNTCLDKYNIAHLEPDIAKCSLTMLNNKVQELNAFQNNLQTVIEYREALKNFDSNKSLPDIDREIYKNNQEMATLAAQMWNSWLSAQRLDITQKQREDMLAYIAGMKLLGDEKLSSDSKLSRLFKHLQVQMTKYLPCWAVTSLSARGRIALDPGIFDLVVIDEASQCDIASVLPLLFRAKRAVIIGDPKQLSHISAINKKQDTKLLEKYDIPMNWSYSACSLYDLANSKSDSDKVIHLLDHHRSVKEIIDFSNHEFYNGNLRIATNYQKLNPPSNTKPGIRWNDVPGKTVRPPSGGAYNNAEVKVVVEELQRLMQSNYKGSIGVVTPFRSQAEHIRNAVANRELQSYLQTNNSFLVDTVHKFQGDERDVIIFSTVISSGTADTAIGFLSKTGNLFNVAITRAKSFLVVVGDINYCLSCKVTYMEHFANYVINLQTVHDEEIKHDIAQPESRNYPIVNNPDQVSDWEKLLYTALYDAGIITIPQYPVDKYKLDLALFNKGKRLDIEVDGEMYHKDWNGELCYRDQLRNQRLFELGWDVKRFWVYQIRDEMRYCINQIKNWMEKE